ncbi:energy transducer TonB [Brevundimonas bullata]|uniref:energy transducer TonB n=1 Tax=Brevundimonas bullata TaxID=13160 RepID=UPI000E0BAEFD|nr:energy transducer TonB [Brevundimonas bullata]
MTAEPHVHRDPILDPPKKKKKLSTGAVVGITVSVIVHALAGLYLYNNKFVLKEMTYEDEAVDVELMEVPPPPPPPAPPAPPKPSVITNPSWSRQVAPEFPERAQSRGIESGSAKVNCAVAPNGSLSDCRVVDEDPAGAGFGQAVLRAARSGRLAPRTVDGAAVGARVEFTTRFRLD